jgi:separase
MRKSLCNIDQSYCMLGCKLWSALILVFLQCLTTLFADETDDLLKRVHDATNILPGFGGLLCLVTEQNDELHRAQGKLQRSIERLRRACIRFLDGEAKANGQMLVSLLMAICTVMEGVFKHVGLDLTCAHRH